MKILFVASELNPLIKVGGLADVVGSLAKEIKQFGHDIRIILPFYQSLKEKSLDPLKKIADINIKIEGSDEPVLVYQTILDHIPLYLIKNDSYITNGDIYLEVSEFSSIARFLFFSQAAVELLGEIDWQPDIIHVHDWQTGIIPLLIKIKGFPIKTVFTIHNLLIQGQWNYKQSLDFLGLTGDEISSLKQTKQGLYGKDLNIVQQALLNADVITTVSPQYAKEIKTDSSYARGLDTEIVKRADDIYGILNGIDTYAFNPKSDPYIPKQYSIKTLDDKGENKLYLQKKAGFKQDKNIPLLGMVTRLDIQKGIDFLASAVDDMVDMECQIVFLGTGQEKYENMLKQCAQKYPKNVAAYIRFDVKLAQQIYAGVDIFLMPSRFEPCGLSQMISMRYGTIPIVRATGGLIDSVENITIKQGLFGKIKSIKGTGFWFDALDKEEFVTTLKRVLHIYSQKKLWRQIQINAMNTDFSWRKSAQKYIKLYKKLFQI
ncbi:glycogen synthase [Patescibacteria group bacterium AH-259-L05]|nr:glycogen synthase [Patescibacteria group bacterium AH-259-L05]